MSEFDRVAKTYASDVKAALGPFASRHNWAMERKAQIIETLLPETGAGDDAIPRVLDVGCGIGLLHPYLLAKMRVTGVDVSEDSLVEAQAAHGGSSTEEEGAEYILYHGNQLPFENDQFELTFASCVFHHVPRDSHKALISEMARVTKPAGCVLIIEHNPWHPATQLIVRTNELDRDAHLLSHPYACRLLRAVDHASTHWRGMLFTPFSNSVFQFIEDVMGRAPVGMQYYAWVTKPDNPHANWG